MHKPTFHDYYSLRSNTHHDIHFRRYFKRQEQSTVSSIMSRVFLAPLCFLYLTLLDNTCISHQQRTEAIPNVQRPHVVSPYKSSNPEALGLGPPAGIPCIIQAQSVSYSGIRTPRTLSTSASQYQHWHSLLGLRGYRAPVDRLDKEQETIPL